MSLEGQRILHYTILSQLETGGMGEIYLARDERFPRYVAFKAIQIDYSHSSDVAAAQEGAQMFLREAQMIAQFNHRHILQLYDVGEHHTQNTLLMYMVMPYCSEGSLFDWLKKHYIQLPLLPQDVADIISQVADALQHAHTQGIVHQDVKPSNLLVQGEAHQINQLHLQLADFGVAKLLATTSENQEIRGTPLYMAPEQWIGQATPATDQYALAVMAYELLSGRLPFAGSNQQQLWYQHKNVQPHPPGTFNSAIPFELDSVILRALQKNPEQRFKSIALFARAFQQAISGDAETNPPRVDPLVRIPPTANAFPRSDEYQTPQMPQPKTGISSIFKPTTESLNNKLSSKRPGTERKAHQFAHRWLYLRVKLRPFRPSAQQVLFLLRRAQGKHKQQPQTLLPLRQHRLPLQPPLPGRQQRPMRR
jgi:serine/threonine protein kinase